jgi:NAD(P)-dependent dehydrogenase (short-subunit alcohol dehydrogenase family)
VPGVDRKRAVVTGGSSGIGEATVRALANRGFDVGFTFRSRSVEALRLEQELRNTGIEIVSRELDLAQGERRHEVITELLDALGGIDVLINNAGENRRSPFLEESASQLRRTLEVNLIGALSCAQVAARRMIAQGTEGRIINITSVLADTPLQQGIAYCASKAALGLATRVMALELAPYGIAVNAVAPGHTATPMNFDGETAALDIEKPMIPLGRPGDPTEIAEAIAFLADRARYVTGSSYLVDGGLLLVAGPQLLE